MTATWKCRSSKWNDKVVVLDANHPLAGEDLTFDIEVIDVK